LKKKQVPDNIEEGSEQKKEQVLQNSIEWVWRVLEQGKEQVLEQKD